MKTFTSLAKTLFGASAVLMVSAGLFTLASCEKCDHEDDPATNTNTTDNATSARPIVKNNLVIPFFVEGANSEWWSNLSDNDVLFEEQLHNRIMAPDGHQVTWGEFNRPTGEARINCTGQGTRINMKMEGLIPKGVYSLFCMKFDSPGFDTTFSHVSGLGAAGAIDGSENTFIASSTGTASLHVTCPEGPLSVFGNMLGCVPTDEFEMHFVAIYHLDGQTHGGSPGPAGTSVENFAFIVLNH